MDPDFRPMVVTLGRAQVALWLSMGAVAKSYLEVTVRNSRRAAEAALGSAERAGQPSRPAFRGADSLVLGYCSFLRELAAVTRVCGMAFFDTLEQLRTPVVGRPGVTGLEGLQDKDIAEQMSVLEKRHHLARGSTRKRPASKHFLQY
jgi:hypothetical protein